jgi:hypothetical protein
MLLRKMDHASGEASVSSPASVEVLTLTSASGGPRAARMTQRVSIV